MVGREISPDKDSQEDNEAYFVGDDSYQAGFLASTLSRSSRLISRSVFPLST